ncbi:MAG: hypothetical protein HOC91_13815 [Nitrospinaceae bacterium]|jgi:uncharacterized OsmC-like protein|nr:hypothetical protein [Nitrospinaceae bacterium]MBT3433203.1 hypothetical protein [Nitrospinaceae bacterium]MBT3823224.1 hypothetical protein [Nitrospinaceae bacterium]MBT4093912.1 hypothetical protein [Nitrospinaceae bacterium]MBT4431581.1 hypothetical protein [Nitrospinaceae bacterium]
MMKTPFKKASCRVEFDYFLRGSVLKSTVDSGCTAVRTHFVVESDESEERVAAVIRNAKQGCFAERMVETAVPLSSTVELNGRSISLA